MRVIAGTARGRRLTAPPGDSVRPTSDRVREAMFNRLESLDMIRDAAVLDLFAGSGALGIEALSRGAASVVFVDEDSASIRSIKANLETLDMDATIHRMNAARFIDSTTERFDLALLDPPYDFADWPELLDDLPAEVAVIESERPIELPSGWSEVKTSSYGRTHVAVVERTQAVP